MKKAAAIAAAAARSPIAQDVASFAAISLFNAVIIIWSPIAAEILSAGRFS